MKGKNLKIMAGLLLVGLLIGFGLFLVREKPLPEKFEMAEEAPQVLEPQIREEILKPEKLKEEEKITVSKEEPLLLSKGEPSYEPGFISDLRYLGIEVKEHKEISSLSDEVSKFYENQDYPKLERKIVEEIPENSVPGELIVKSVNWQDGGSYRVRYYQVRVRPGDEQKAIDVIKRDPEVVVVEPNIRIKIQSAVTIDTDSPEAVKYDPYFNNQWALKKIQADEAWKEEKGKKEIKIAVLDSGIDLQHPDLKDNVDLALSCDYINDDSEPEDEHPLSHGSHVAGIIGAKGFNNIGVHGVINNATLIIHKILKGKETDVPIITLASTISQALAKGARVINMSWITKTDMIKESAILKDIFQTAFASNTLLVASAGNQGKVYYPAKYEQVLAVAGTDKEDKRWISKVNPEYHSAYGEEIDVSAPAEEIYSTMVRKNDGSEQDGYGYLSGTSMSSALVSGLAGLLLSKNPDLTKDELIKLIKENVDEVTTEKGKPIGTGRINAKKAISLVRAGGEGELEAVAYVGKKGQKEITVNIGDEVQFLGEYSIAPQEYPSLNYEWDFGDGETSDEMNPTHVYQKADKYTAFLVVSLGENTDADFVIVKVEQEAKTEVFGKVSDEEGKAIQGAEVILKYNLVYEEEGRVVEFDEIQTTTDLNGEYQIQFYIDETQVIIITAKKEDKLDEKKSKINPGERIRVDFILSEVPEDEIWISGKVTKDGEPQQGVKVKMRLEEKEGKKVFIKFINESDPTGSDGKYEIKFTGLDPAKKYDLDLLAPEKRNKIMKDLEPGKQHLYNIELDPSPTPTPQCISDSDCPKGLKCHFGKCVQCVFHKDCKGYGSRMICSDDRCVEGPSWKKCKPYAVCTADGTWGFLIAPVGCDYLYGEQSCQPDLTPTPTPTPDPCQACWDCIDKGNEPEHCGCDWCPI